MEYNPINALKMKSFSGYTPKNPYRWAVTNVCCQFLCIPVIPEKSFVSRGYKHVGMRLAYFACPYPYVFVKRECPRDAKAFLRNYGKQKNLTQTEGVLGLRTVEKRGILLEDLIHYNNE